MVSPTCQRSRALVSQAMDEPLSELEGHALELHLDECAACRAYARRVDRCTRAIREADLETMRVSWHPPRRRSSAGLGRGLLATAAVVAVALGIAGASELATGPDGERPFGVLVIDATGADTAEETRTFLRGLRDATLARTVGGPLRKTPIRPGPQVD